MDTAKVILGQHTLVLFQLISIIWTRTSYHRSEGQGVKCLLTIRQLKSLHTDAQEYEVDECITHFHINALYWSTELLLEMYRLVNYGHPLNNVLRFKY